MEARVGVIDEGYVSQRLPRLQRSQRSHGSHTIPGFIFDCLLNDYIHASIIPTIVVNYTFFL